MTKMEPRTSCEREHEFALVLTGISDFDDDFMDSLFEAGCDDATPCLRYGTVVLTFARSAGSLREAILSAIRDIRNAKLGVDVLQVDECNLVTQAEIARRSGRSRQVVHQYSSGKRGPGGFPPPACHITEGVPLWAWCSVAYWLRQNGMIKEQEFVDAQDVDLINSMLDYQHRLQVAPEAVAELLDSLGAAPAKA
jgi:hypothetical protein